jgi:KDO2-lipid IV(A) lauroyltransferase
MARPSLLENPWPRRLRDAAVTGLFVAVVAPFLLLPVDRVTRLAGAAGRAVLPLLPARRRIEGNLALVWPTRDKAADRALIAEVGETFARTIMEYIRLPTLAAMPERRRVSGADGLLAAVAAGRGVVIVSAHLGNWEMIRLAARDLGVEVGIIYRAFNNESFDRVAMLRIRAAGEPVLHKGREGQRGMLALLRRGGVLLVLMDQHGTGGLPAPFLGRPALTITAIPKLCLRSGAVLLPARALRDADGMHFDVRFEAPLTGDDPDEMTREINRRIERWVCERPGQWFWLHRRWRPGNSPDGEFRVRL